MPESILHFDEALTERRFESMNALVVRGFVGRQHRVGHFPPGQAAIDAQREQVAIGGRELVAQLLNLALDLGAQVKLRRRARSLHEIIEESGIFQGDVARSSIRR